MDQAGLSAVLLNRMKQRFVKSGRFEQIERLRGVKTATKQRTASQDGLTGQRAEQG